MAHATIIGVPKEIKTDEHRVAATPGSVKSLVAAGFTVVVEKGAGVGSGHSDEAYAKAGALLVDTHVAVFEAANLIVKVKEPIACEYALIKAHHTVFTFFHLAGSRELTETMMKTGATCIAYETIEKADGTLPILAPMSEVAGRLSIQMGMRFLEKTHGGSGVLLAGVPGVPPGSVVVIGAGVAGTNAAVVAAGVGADVVLLDTNIGRLRALAQWLPRNVKTAFSSFSAIETHLAHADLAVGAALVTGARAPVLVSEATLRSMKPGSVFVDIAIDQGGCTEVSHATTHRDPVFKVGETTLYCVANMPGCVPRTSTEAIVNAATPYLFQIAKLGWGAALSANPELMKGLNVAGGKLTLKAVAEQFELPFHDPTPLAAAAAQAANADGNGKGAAPVAHGRQVAAAALPPRLPASGPCSPMASSACPTSPLMLPASGHGQVIRTICSAPSVGSVGLVGRLPLARAARAPRAAPRPVASMALRRPSACATTRTAAAAKGARVLL